MKSKSDYSRHVVAIAALSRLLCLSIAWLSSFSMRLDNQRNTIVFGNEPRPQWLYDFLSPLVQWDGIHFLNIAARGYDSVLEHAFFPGLPMVMRLLSHLNPLGWVDPPLSLGLAGIVFVQLSFILGALGLYKISEFFLMDSKVAFKSTLFYVFAPSNIFMSALYTESPFSMLTFWGLYWLHVRKHLWAAVIFFSLSTLFRSNGLLSAGFLLHESLRRNQRIFDGILGAACVYIPYYLYSTWSKNLYCEPSLGDVRHDWCVEFSTIYGYIQKTFWKVTPFAYWRISNIPYFALMTPALIVSVYGIFSFLRTIISLLTTKRSLWRNFKKIIDMWELGFVCQMGILTVFTVFVANCQILTRILSSCPFFFWSIERLHRRAPTLTLTIQFVYYLVGSILFSNGFNWT
jgi:phosphatidylinositol glycan class V